LIHRQKPSIYQSCKHLKTTILFLTEFYLYGMTSLVWLIQKTHAVAQGFGFVFTRHIAAGKIGKKTSAATSLLTFVF
jgi:hypothetical protein